MDISERECHTSPLKLSQLLCKTPEWLPTPAHNIPRIEQFITALLRAPSLDSGLKQTTFPLSLGVVASDVCFENTPYQTLRLSDRPT